MRKYISLALLAALGLAGCGEKAAVASSEKGGESAGPAPDKPEAFLKWSMDRYKRAPSYRADASVSMNFGGMPGAPQARKFEYESPNRFKVVSTGAAGFVQTSVSNGKDLVEYASMGTPANSYPAPEKLSDVTSMQMQHPMFCGSLLYQFFGGSANYDGLVDGEKGAVSFGKEEAVDGEKCHAVKFYGKQQYGHVEAMIGEKTGWVYRIQYDSEPTTKALSSGQNMEEMQKTAKEEVAKMKPGKEKDQAEAVMGLMSAMKDIKLSKYDTIETYSKIESPAKLTDASFDTTIPKGLETMKMPSPPSDKPPVALGEMAPDFQVASLDGKPVKLSSFRGHVVLIDFWATWCGPCRIGLPETDRLAKVGGPKGLQVMAISDEDGATISAFMKENKYSMPTYRDEGAATQKAYGISGIPTTVIIDAEGKLSAFFVGLHDKGDILKALAKAGMPLS